MASEVANLAIRGHIPEVKRPRMAQRVVVCHQEPPTVRRWRDVLDLPIAPAIPNMHGKLFCQRPCACVPEADLLLHLAPVQRYQPIRPVAECDSMYASRRIGDGHLPYSLPGCAGSEAQLAGGVACDDLFAIRAKGGCGQAPAQSLEPRPHLAGIGIAEANLAAFRRAEDGDAIAIDQVTTAGRDA